MTRTYILGDIHGQFPKLVRLLRDAGLVDGDLHWAGGSHALWCIGDYFDRGPSGSGALDLLMRLQGEAAAAGGQVGGLVGNHDVLILAARRFRNIHSGGEQGTYFEDWLANGGLPQDLLRLTPAHVDWLCALPAMQLLGDYLLVHADALFYQRYGRSIDDVNAGIHDVLANGRVWAWDQLLDNFSDRRAFLGDAGPEQARAFLETYGGRHIIHGHTPISKVTGQAAEEITQPLVYAEGLCTNVDGGMYLGGPGFLHIVVHP
jgi:hypothetical protein